MQVQVRWRALWRAVEASPMFADLPSRFRTARYHSIYIDANKAPEGLRVLGRTDDGVAMAVGHESLPVWAVQFHPESILTLEHDHGLQVVRNVVGMAVAA